MAADSSVQARAELVAVRALLAESEAALATARARISELEAAPAPALPPPVPTATAAAAAAPPARPHAPADAGADAPTLGAAVRSLGELSLTSPRGKVDVILHERGLLLRAKAFALRIPAEALARCVEVDAGARGGTSCLLQLRPSGVGREGAVPKGGDEYLAWTRKPADLDLRAALAAARIGPDWTTASAYRGHAAARAVDCYCKVRAAARARSGCGPGAVRGRPGACPRRDAHGRSSDLRGRRARAAPLDLPPRPPRPGPRARRRRR
jgi:hypothetical protein